MEKKYELTNIRTLAENKNGGSKWGYRIRALRSIPRYNVCVGDLGGFVERETNLSQDGDCWIAENSIVTDNAIVKDDALARGCSRMTDNSSLTGESIIYDKVRLTDQVSVSGMSVLRDNIIASEQVIIRDSSVIVGQSRLTGNCLIEDSPYLNSVSVSDSSHIFGMVRLLSAVVKKDASIGSPRDFCSLSLIGDHSLPVTAYKTKTHGILINGMTLREFELFFRGCVDCLTSEYNIQAFKAAIKFMKRQIVIS